MDPASLAIGVVGLAVNIVQVSSSVRQKVSNYKSASTEIGNILEKTDFIAQVCSRLEIDISSSPSRYDVAIIQPALRKCYVSVSNVNNDLENISKRQQGRNRSLQYVFKKDHIDRSLSDLNESISMLTACVSISTHLCLNNVYASQDCRLTWLTFNRTSTLFQQKLSICETPRSTREIGVQASPGSLSIGIPQKRTLTAKTRCTAYSSSLLVFTASKTCTEDENKEADATHRSYLVGSPIIGAFFSLAVRYGRLSPFSLALDTSSILYEKDNKTLYDTIIQSAPKSGATSQCVAKWVHKFNIKPNMQLVEAYDGLRHSMLGMLVASKKFEAAKYLIERGGQQLGSEQFIFYGLPWNSTWVSYQPELLKLYIEMRGPLLTMEEYFEMLMPSDNPKTVVELIDYCIEIFRDDMENFVWHTMYSLSIMFQSSYSRYDPESWALPLRNLLAAGLDIHDCWDVKERTWLGRLLTSNITTSTQTLECCEKWVEVIGCTSIPVDGYMLVELHICMENPDDRFEAPQEWMSSNVVDPWHSMSIKTKLELMFDMLNPGYRVPLYVDYETKDDLLQLVPSFREGGGYCLGGSHAPVPSHLDWKLDRMTDDDPHFPNWPFLKSTRSIHCAMRGYRNLDERTTQALASHDRFLELMSTRFERRQQKKWEKLKRRTRIQEDWLNAPGGWEMDWWEYQGAW